jgi:hypothetical protein
MHNGDKFSSFCFGRITNFHIQDFVTVQLKTFSNFHVSFSLALGVCVCVCVCVCVLISKHTGLFCSLLLISYLVA